MAKTPRTRHSTSKKEPVTIDIEAVRADMPDDEREDLGEQTVPPDEPVAPSEPTESTAASEQNSESPEIAEAASDATSGAKSPEQASRSSNSGALLGGVVGGVVALVLGGGLQYAGIVPSMTATQQTAPQLVALQQQLSTLQGDVAELRMSSPGSAEEALNTALATPLQQIATLRQSVESLEQQMTARVESSSDEALVALEQKRTELETSFADLSKRLNEAGAQNGDLAQRLHTTENDMAGLREAVQSAAETGRIAATEAASAATARIDEVAGTVQSLSNRVDDLSAQVAKQDEGPKVALIVAASSLKSAIERGSPFGSELETYSSLASNAADFDQLRSFAEQGIPTLTTLTAEVSKVASNIASAASAPDASAGFMDRLMLSARSVVNVRPVGKVAGDGPAEIAARMEAAVKRGDLAAAIKEFDTLPPASQALGTEFSKQLRAREAATQILDKALSTALKPA